VSGNGSGPVDLGGGEWVGEHQRRVRELAMGSVGREDGWRRGLRGSLGGGGDHGGRRRPFQVKGGARGSALGSEWREEG
jgi:hypothetical protein